jgi:hypothetical protein
MFYVTNTLLRWSVLQFLTSTVPASTWFFGRDNLGLGLELELYVHNLVANTRVVFLEFGGKTSATALYPRSLHLLVREFYVIAIPTPDPGTQQETAVITTVERLRDDLTHRRRELFRELQQRRRALYSGLPAGADLQTVQQRVWADFYAR